jgi:hypothetical protein
VKLSNNWRDLWVDLSIEERSFEINERKALGIVPRDFLNFAPIIMEGISMGHCHVILQIIRITS